VKKRLNKMNYIFAILALGLTTLGTQASIQPLKAPTSLYPSQSAEVLSYRDQFNQHLSEEDIASLKKYQQEQMTMLNKCIEKVGLKVGSSPKNSTQEKRNAFLGCVTVEYLSELQKYDLPDTLVYWALTSATRKLITGFAQYD
jgi:hypothetical protein